MVTIDVIIFWLIPLFVFVSSYFTFKFYRVTKLVDYLIFTIAIFIFALSQAGNALGNFHLDDNLTLYLINSMFVHITVNLFLLFLFWQTYRMNHSSAKYPLTILGIFNFLYILGVILSSRKVIPRSSIYFGVELLNLPNDIGDTGWVFVIRDTPLFGTGRLFLLYLQVLIVSCLGIYYYAKVDLVVNDSKAKSARRHWMLLYSSWALLGLQYLLYSIRIIEWLPILDVFGIIALINLIIIGIRYPEGLILSETQVARAVLLYEIAKPDPVKQIPDNSAENLLQYIQKAQSIIDQSSKVDSIDLSSV